jgi:hypothetical protein
MSNINFRSFLGKCLTVRPSWALVLAVGSRYNRVEKESSFDQRETSRGRTGFDRALDVPVACRGWSAGHVKSRPKNLIAESNLAMAA